MGSENKTVEKDSMKTKETTKIERPQRRRVTFRCEAGSQRDVHLAGSFNNWNTTTHRMIQLNGKGKYVAAVLLPVGRYEYKFIVDHKWQCDSANAEQVPNGYGTLNSVIVVG